MPFAALLGMTGVLLAVKGLEVVGSPPIRVRIAWPRLARAVDGLRAPAIQDAASVGVIVTWIFVCLHGGVVTPLRVLVLVVGWVAYGALDRGGRPPRRQERPSRHPGVLSGDGLRRP